MPKIAVIGDHCLDIDYVGEYDGLMSREIEKLPIFNCSHVRYSGGGAANIVDIMNHLGVEVRPVGAWGDIEGDILQGLWDAQEVIHSYMIYDQPTPSFIKYYQRSGQHIFRMNRKSRPLKVEIDDLICSAIHRIEPLDALIVADYDETNNGIVSWDVLCHAAMCDCLKIGISRTEPEMFTNFTAGAGSFQYVFTNTQEYRSMKGRGEYSLGPKFIITMGALGSCIETGRTSDSRTVDIAGDKQLTKDIDICGCGDSFLSAFVIKKLEGLSDLECLQWGNAAGRAQARKLYGAHTLTWEEIRNEYEELYG